MKKLSDLKAILLIGLLLLFSSELYCQNRINQTEKMIIKSTNVNECIGDVNTNKEIVNKDKTKSTLINDDQLLPDSTHNQQTNASAIDRKILQGTIINVDGQPLPGIYVLEKGTVNGTITDVNGKFQLNVSKKAKITISYIGMKALEFDSGEFSNIRFHFTDELLVGNQGLLEFCCRNHNPSHCATKLKEMKKLTTKENCSF